MILSHKVGDTLRDGLVLDLPLSEKDSDIFMSDDVYGHLCTNHGSDWNIQGHTFNGISDYINCGNDESLDCNDSMAVSFFTKFPVQSGHKQFLFKDGYATGWYIRTNADGAIISKIDDGINDCYANAILTAYDDMLWYHITVIVEDRVSMKIYINGELKDTGNPSAVGSIVNNQNLFIGTQSPVTNHLNGSIDDVRIYNRVLSKNEIRLLYDQTKGKYL